MKTGIFCNYENYHQDARRALHEQVKLVQHAESLGFEEAWVTEHHFNDFRFDNKPMSSDESSLLENSVVGDVATCRDKIQKFQDELSLGTLALKPASFELQKNLESLTRYNSGSAPLCVMLFLMSHSDSILLI